MKKKTSITLVAGGVLNIEENEKTFETKTDLTFDCKTNVRKENSQLHNLSAVAEQGNWQCI